MQKLIYATDFSENAEKALPYALNLAHKHNAALILLHVFDIPTAWNYPYASGYQMMEKQAYSDTENKLRELFDRNSGSFPGVNAQFITIENISIVKGILSIIEKENPELLVIGTKGGSKLRELIVGSTTKSLIKKSPCPVLATPDNAVGKDFKHILYATDFRTEDTVAIQKLIALVQPFEPEITLLHISTPKEYKGDLQMEWFKEEVNEKISYERIKFELVLDELIYNKLNAYIHHHPMDLLVMLEKEKEGWLNSLFQQDLVQKMEFHTSIPVLSFNEHYLHL